jgi:hypothetical protein
VSNAHDRRQSNPDSTSRPQFLAPVWVR